MSDKDTRAKIQRLRAAGFSLANAERMAHGTRGKGWFLVVCLLVALFLIGGILVFAFERYCSTDITTAHIHIPQEDAKA
jgi:hypothetical protein|tara:strand:+ start:150 stop:386 length:237 start_codon:yes stop_codon:yes gene_type:complete